MLLTDASDGKVRGWIDENSANENWPRCFDADDAVSRPDLLCEFFFLSASLFSPLFLSSVDFNVFIVACFITLARKKDRKS